MECPARLSDSMLMCVCLQAPEAPAAIPQPVAPSPPDPLPARAPDSVPQPSPGTSGLTHDDLPPRGLTEWPLLREGDGGRDVHHLQVHGAVSSCIAASARAVGAGLEILKSQSKTPSRKCISSVSLVIIVPSCRPHTGSSS